METLIIYLVLLIVVAVVLSPLLRPSRPALEANVPTLSAVDEWMYEKRIAEDIISDLQFDWQTGKLDESDHRQLIERQKKIIHEIDEKIRRGQRSGQDEWTRHLTVEIEKTRERLSREIHTTCPQCGQRTGKQARFCSQCGSRLD